MKLNYNQYNIQEPKENVIILKDDSEYIPLSTIYAFMRKFRTDHTSNVPRIFKVYYPQDKYNTKDELLKEFKNQIQDNRHLEDLRIIYAQRYTHGMSDIIRDSFEEYSRFISQQRTHDKYISGLGLLGQLNTLNQLSCLYCIVLKKENALGVINALLQDKDIPNDILELWIDERLYKRGAKFFTKIKKQVQDKVQEFITNNPGIILKQVQGFSFFPMIKLPTWSTLKIRNQWIKELFNKMKDGMNIVNKEILEEELVF